MNSWWLNNFPLPTEPTRHWPFHPSSWAELSSACMHPSTVHTRRARDWNTSVVTFAGWRQVLSIESFLGGKTFLFEIWRRSSQASSKIRYGSARLSSYWSPLLFKREEGAAGRAVNASQGLRKSNQNQPIPKDSNSNQSKSVPTDSNPRQQDLDHGSFSITCSDVLKESTVVLLAVQSCLRSQVDVPNRDHVDQNLIL